MVEVAEKNQLSLRKGEILIEEGTEGNFIYLIKTGQLEVRKMRLTDHPRKLGVRGPGEVVGEMSMFDNKPHMARVVAISDATVLAMSRADFQARFADIDPIVKATVQTIVKRARQMGDMLLEQPEWPKPPKRSRPA